MEGVLNPTCVAFSIPLSMCHWFVCICGCYHLWTKGPLSLGQFALGYTVGVRVEKCGTLVLSSLVTISGLIYIMCIYIYVHTSCHLQKVLMFHWNLENISRIQTLHGALVPTLLSFEAPGGWSWCPWLLDVTWVHPRKWNEGNTDYPLGMVRPLQS